MTPKNLKGAQESENWSEKLATNYINAGNPPKHGNMIEKTKIIETTKTFGRKPKPKLTEKTHSNSI